MTTTTLTPAPGLDSLRSLVASLPRPELRAKLALLTEEEATAILHDWELWARESQLPPATLWRVWLVLAGRGYGKTRVGAEWVRAQVRRFQYVNLIAKSRDEYRDVMIEGESGILACCPKHERPEWQPTRRMLSWPNGARTLCFTAEEPEQLRGPQHQRLWGDEFAKWPYRRETWDNAILGLRLPPDPRALLTTTPKPVPELRELVKDSTVHVTKGTSYENRANLDPAWYSDLIGRYEGTRLGEQELNAELLLDEGLAYRLIDGTHVVPPFPVDNWWQRFEAMDYGTSAPTSWGAFAVDYDGNIVAFGLHYQAGYPSDTAPAIHRRRDTGWWTRDDQGRLVPAQCFAPRDIRTRYTRTEITGTEVSAETEFNERGIYFAKAQQDRRAGYIRIAELLKEDASKPFPVWHPRYGETGSPGLFVLDLPEMEPLISQLRDAPLEDVDSALSKLPGEAVEEDWEKRLGHAHAMLRYAAMARPTSSTAPQPVSDDPRAERVAARLERITARERADLVDV